MIVFRTFLKILNKNKFLVILYTVILLVFGIANMQTSENNMSFTPSKPDVLIINYDEKTGITKNLIQYITDNSNIIDIENDEEKINDALFYRDVSYVIYIPKHYHKDFMDGKNPELKIKSTGDYKASFEEMILSRYIKVANTYQKSIKNEEELIRKIHNTLSKKTEVEMTSDLDTNALSKATYYYNFASYSILACLLLIVSLILNSFHQEKIRKRIAVSKMNYKKHNRLLLLSNCCYSLLLWIFYVGISFILAGDVMFSLHGLIYIINSFLLTVCATTIAFFIGTIVQNKEAINGIVNVIALGSSFLCGVFVPMKWLPDTILQIAHVIPTYYYVSINDALQTLEQFNLETLKPILINMGVLAAFSVFFVILTNIVARRRRKIG